MGILWTILIGFVAGLIAKFIVPGSREPSGFILTTILGIVGALVGGWIGTALGYGTVQHFDLRSMLIAVAGAILVLLIFGLITGRRR